MAHWLLPRHTKAHASAKSKEPFFQRFFLTLHREIFILYISPLCSVTDSSTKRGGEQMFSRANNRTITRQSR